MNYLDPLPRTIVTEDAWIPMPDGVRLHARIWRPEDSTTHPVPGLLEYLPYRLDDWTAPRDSERHPYYAGHGYASVRVDIRGTGSSDGHFDDEYSEQEQRDGLAVIEWIADQPWCDGALGMFGISWGGFNSLQLASHAPDALKAIVTVCSSDDRYDNDVHYMGGAMLGIDMASWAGTMFAFNSRPPRPEIVGDSWVEQWRDRLQSTKPMGATWLSHQERDDYWRQGSVCEDYSTIQAPVLAVGGWHDPYRDTVLRLLENLQCPARGIIGPWSHQYPDRGLAPGPGMAFLQETVRWWDRWLKGEKNGADGGPQLRAYIPDSVRPATYYEQRPGRWVGIDGWPTDAVAPQPLALADAGCSVPIHGGRAIVKSPQHTGMDAGRYFPYGNETDLPPDQRSDDGRSASFDFAPLEEAVEILGNVKLRLRLASDRPQANVIARLCDVAPDGSSTLVTRGVLNLNKRNGRHRADPMPVGEMTDVAFDMVSVGYAVPAGHTLRIAISSAYWPWIWPHPEEAALTLDVAACRIELPAHRHVGGGPAVEMGEPEQSQPLPIEPLAKTNGEVSSAFIAPAQRSTWNDAATGEWVLDVDPGYGGSRRYPDGLLFTEYSRETYRIRQDDPLSATAASAWSIALEKDGWKARVETHSHLSAEAEKFVLTNTVTAYARQGEAEEELVATIDWHDVVPRTSA